MDSSACGVKCMACSATARWMGFSIQSSTCIQKQGSGIGFRRERGKEADGGFKMLEIFDFGPLGTAAGMAKRVAETHFNGLGATRGVPHEIKRSFDWLRFDRCSVRFRTGINRTGQIGQDVFRRRE